MNALKVSIALCLSALPSEDAMDSQTKSFRENYPQAKVTVTYQVCESDGKKIKILKGKKVTYSQ